MIYVESTESIKQSALPYIIFVVFVIALPILFSELFFLGFVIVPALLYSLHDKELCDYCSKQQE